MNGCLSALFALGLPGIAGSMVLRRVLPPLSTRWVKTCADLIGAGLGVGVASLLMFGAMVAFDEPPRAYPLFEVAGFGAAIAVLLWSGRGSPPSMKDAEAASTPTQSRVLCWALRLGLPTLALASLVRFVGDSLLNPHGKWDAWAIWNLRARFLLRAGAEWRGAFDDQMAWSHPDYPLLIPLTNLRGWLFSQTESLFLPIATAFFFCSAQVLLTYAALRVLRDRTQAALGAVILLAAPLFVSEGASQYADVPFGFFLLSTLVLLALEATSAPGSRRLIAAAGLSASLAAWTKNEGSLFLLAVALSRGAMFAIERGPRVAVRRMAPFVLGTAPALAALLFFKWRIAPSSEIFAADRLPQMLEQLSSVSRFLTIARELRFEVLISEHWSGIPMVLLGYALLMGWTFARTMTFAVATLTLVVAGYVLTYLITPYDLAWHLQTSLGRLLVQLWPSYVLVYFSIINGPELLVAGPEMRAPRHFEGLMRRGGTDLAR